MPPSPARFIGVGASGKQVGKSTFSRVFAQIHNFKVQHFGDELKREVAELLNTGELREYYSHRTGEQTSAITAARQMENTGKGFSELYRIKTRDVEQYIRNYALDISQATRLLTVVQVWKSQSVHSGTLDNPQHKEKWFREWMQWWGTEVRRAQNPNFWVDIMDWERPSVFGDLRFGPGKKGSETDAIHQHGGKTVFLYNAIAEGKDAHSSESLRREDCDLWFLWPHNDRDICYHEFCDVSLALGYNSPTFEVFNETLDKILAGS
jgi:hypothetical protein